MPKLVAKREDWIQLGYVLFAEKGITGIIVENMAKKLNVNKSSFYWHFNTKKEFVSEIIQFWIKTETEQVIQLTEKAETHEERLNRFLTIAFKNDPYLEFIFFLKRYAIKDKTIQQVIDEVDNRRLSFTSTLFQETMGYTQAEATTKARIFYHYLIGYHEMIKNKKQSKNYLNEVKEDLKHFLKL